MFPRGDSEQLAWLIKYLYEERNIRNGMGAKARFRAVSIYDSARMAKEVESQYQSILG
jgi:glycosyltransferase involved in cell wall biosynthesis